MEFATELLSPYKDLLGQVVGIVSVGQMLSVVLLLNTIRKRGHTNEDDNVVPFLGGLVLSVIAVRFGVALGDDAVIRANFIGLALSIVFVGIFYYYTPNAQKNAVWRSTGVAGAVASAILAYAQYEDQSVLADRLGLVLFVFVFILTSLPLLSVPQIVRTKSVGPLPFPLVVAGFLVSLGWALYGVASANAAMALQNTVLFAINSFVLSLFFVYPNKAKSPKKSKKKSN